jgi:hypothetical protein
VVLLDAAPAFTPDAIYRRRAGYGDAGRQNYAFRNVTTDVLLPLSLLPFLVLLIGRAVARFSVSQFQRGLLLSVPVVYVAFDLLENASVIALVARYPERMNVATSLPYTTLVKRAASLLALVIPLTMFAVHLVRSRQLPAVVKR